MTPEQEEAVRRALAAAPPAGPMPADVAARLDATLADLGAGRTAGASQPGRPEQPEPDQAGQPQQLRRPGAGGTAGPGRSRRWTGLLVAAATVAVAGVGVGVVIDHLGGSGSGSDSQAGATSDMAGGDNAARDAPESQDGLGQPAQNTLVALGARPVPLRSAGLAADAARVLEERRLRRVDLAGVLAGTSQLASGTGAEAATVRQLAACELPDLARGDVLVVARLDGERGTLVLHRAAAGTRVAQFYACDDASRSVATARVADR
ncbi:hypothetical protein [Nocardioides mesophilus]|uniref:Uncharacterized protein n=1 Tax=Nocardioides mesophilus TaxID=433659 RepID=A0A7G9RFQ9_9ACTN|nr:hypothetical protein [Nocardioides mesophilus]QNN54434.1 hypothetical protein H9L09_08990 [Nocardioides mesophilus]